MIFPDALLLDGLVVFPQSASRGYALVLPDLRHARPAVINSFAAAWETFFKDLPDSMRLQFQTNRLPDYSVAFHRHAAETKTMPSGWCRRVREERHHRYTERMRSGKLLREQAVLFISVPLEHNPHLLSSPFGLEARYGVTLQQASQQIQIAADNLGRLLAAHGGHLIAFNDQDHHRHFARWLNPSLAQRPEFDPLATFDPVRPVQANCWWSEASGADFGFHMDGHYHALRAFTRWPRQLDPLKLHPVWQVPGGNFRVTLNLRLLDKQQIIHRAERQLRRLEGQYESERKPSLLPSIEKLRKRIEHLAAGFARPLAVEILVHTWAASRAALTAQTAAVEQSMQACDAQYFAPTLPTTNKRLFAQSWPAYPWGGYSHYQLHADSTFVPCLLPLVASFTGYVETAEAYYESPQNSLVGLRTTSGGQPLHFVCFGGTGSGKSMFLQDLISQIAGQFQLIALVDYGQSYETLIGLLDPGSSFLVLRANAAFTINYLDTQELPLTSEHLADCVALVLLMIGGAGDARLDALRRAVITEALKRLYASRFNELERQEPQRALDVARRALVLSRRQEAGADPLDAFVDYRDWQKDRPDEAQSLLESISEQDALAFLKNPSTRPTVISLACAELKPHEQPTHRELQECLRLRAASGDEPVAADLATLLLDWCRGGIAGQLVDGVSTVSLNRPVMGFEMGLLDDKVPALQPVSRHLVNTHTWRRIFARPRRERKLILFEETSAFLDLPGADALIRRAYEQARKFNAVIGTVFQNYSRLRDMPIRASIMGNARQFFLMKQDDPADLKQLVDDLGLPDSVMDTIKTFPNPAEAGYAAFALFSRDTPHPVCGVAHHVPSPEMLYVTNSTPAHVDQRRAALRNTPDALTQIQELI